MGALDAAVERRDDLRVLDRAAAFPEALAAIRRELPDRDPHRDEAPFRAEEGRELRCGGGDDQLVTEILEVVRGDEDEIVREVVVFDARSEPAFRAQAIAIGDGR